MMLKTDLLNSLADDILMQILIRIPAQDILNSATFVCRKWWQLIRTHNFKFSHLDHSTSGLVITHLGNVEGTFISMTQAGQIEISTFSSNIINRFWSSCNGLMLSPTSRYSKDLIIRNPVTRQHFPLPSFFSSATAPLGSYGTTLNHRLSVISFIATRMEYKVVRMYDTSNPQSSSRLNKCAILTVGVDNSWRGVDTQHLSIEAASKYFRYIPLVTQGFVHWVEDSRYILDTETTICDQFVLTLNVETEVITQILAPAPCNGKSGSGCYYIYFPGGSSCYLSLLIGQGYLRWEVWELRPETGEWTKLPDIDLEACKGLLNEELYDKQKQNSCSYKLDDDCKLIPTGWLNYRQVIVFAVFRATDLKMGSRDFRALLHAVYNLQTQTISFFTLQENAYTYLVHRNSLVGFPD